MDGGTPMTSLDERLIELEVRVAYQERTLEDLSEELRGAHARIATLERELARLAGPAEEETVSSAPSS